MPFRDHVDGLAVHGGKRGEAAQKPHGQRYVGGLPKRGGSRKRRPGDGARRKVHQQRRPRKPAVRAGLHERKRPMATQRACGSAQADHDQCQRAHCAPLSFCGESACGAASW